MNEFNKNYCVGNAPVIADLTARSINATAINIPINKKALKTSISSQNIFFSNYYKVSDKTFHALSDCCGYGGLDLSSSKHLFHYVYFLLDQLSNTNRYAIFLGGI